MTSTPFKCPPAPSETALLMHDFLTERGLRDRSEISLVMPLPVPIPPSPAASEALLAAFAERGIDWHPQTVGARARPRPQGGACSPTATRCPTTSSSAYPCTASPAVVAESGMTVDGWIPVNPLTLETTFPGVYAVGDVTSVGTPKAGVFAEGQAAVVADRISARHPGADGSRSTTGAGCATSSSAHDQVARVDVTFVSGQAPTGGFDGPSHALAADKDEFGSSRIQRWFGHTWHKAGAS